MYSFVFQISSFVYFVYFVFKFFSAFSEQWFVLPLSAVDPAPALKRSLRTKPPFASFVSFRALRVSNLPPHLTKLTDH